MRVKERGNVMRLVLLFCLLALGLPARAEGVRLVIPFAAGGAADVLARQIQPAFSDALGQSVVVDNRGGAGGALANELAAKSPADGNTLLVGSLGTIVLNSSLVPRLPYDVRRDFVPVALLGQVPGLLITQPEVAQDFAGLEAAQRRLGRPLTYGSAGPGTTMHISGELLRLATGLPLTHVPYRGAGPALTDMLAGNVDLVMADLPVLLPVVRAGTARALATLGEQRSPLLPEVPTGAELGVPSFRLENWYGILAPAGVPAAKLAEIEAALVNAMAKPEVAQKYAETGMHGGGGSTVFRHVLDRDFATWPDLLRRLDIRLE
jgi:tripartite-type tricarboxylate transporter receptor subunit TctC